MLRDILYLSVFGLISSNFGLECVPGVSGDGELAGRARERLGQVLHMCAGVRFHQELPILCTVD